MITHHITKYTKPVNVFKKPHKQTSSKFKGKLGSDEHKLFILTRSLINCNFTINEAVVYRRENYTISEIYGCESYDFMEWDGLAPKFVELINSDGEIIYVNPGQLKKLHNTRRK